MGWPTFFISLEIGNLMKMKTEFMAAISQLATERGLPREVVLGVLESALVSAYKKEAFAPDDDIKIKFDIGAGNIKVYIQKAVTEIVTNPHKEISLSEAMTLQDNVQIGTIVEIEATPKNAGRIAAQTARQVISQRLREAEYHATYEEFANKEGEILTGTIQFIDPKQVYVRVGRTEAILPSSEQISNERYHTGQQLKFYLLQINKGSKEIQTIVSRTHPNLLRRLLELEVPEIHNGIVEITGIARDPGYRSKVAVSTSQENIDPVGCCIGPRGIRIQSIVRELNGEKIDIIQWNIDPEIFIPNALKPAQVTSVELDNINHTAILIVPDRQLSLAIGKDGQNARLAARLTGWRIDIKSASAAAAEQERLQEQTAAAWTAAVKADEEPATENETADSQTIAETEGLLANNKLSLTSEAPADNPEKQGQIRFAEDILHDRTTTDISKGKKTKPKKKTALKKQKSHYPEDNDEYEE